MRRLLVLAALLASGFATPAYAQDDAFAACMAGMGAVVRPILQQAGQFSPSGMGAAGFVPLAQPFAPPGYVTGPGIPPGPPGLAPPTAQYNQSAAYTGFAGVAQPGQISSPQVMNYLLATGQLNPAV